MNTGAWWATVHGVTESDTTEQLTHTLLSEWHYLDPVFYIILSRNQGCRLKAYSPNLLAI